LNTKVEMNPVLEIHTFKTNPSQPLKFLPAVKNVTGTIRLFLIPACDICTFVHVHFLSGDFFAAALMYMDFGKFHFLYSPVTSLFCF